MEIDNLHSRLKRSKLVIFVIVAFLALLSYILISVSNELANVQMMGSKAYTTEGYALENAQGMLSDQQNNSVGFFNNSDLTASSPEGDELTGQTTTDPKKCYEITGDSGGSSLHPIGNCNLTIFCSLKSISLEEFAQKIDKVFKDKYAPDFACNVKDGKVNCTGSGSCALSYTNLKHLFEQYCAGCEPTPIPTSADVPPQQPPQEPEPTKTCAEATLKSTPKKEPGGKYCGLGMYGKVKVTCDFSDRGRISCDAVVDESENVCFDPNREELRGDENLKNICCDCRPGGYYLLPQN